MSSVPTYSRMPTDWVRIADVGVEMKRVAGMSLIAGCTRLWMWMLYRGVRSDGGVMVCSWDVAMAELRVSKRQVYRWRTELEACGWCKRGGTGRVWLHPDMDMIRRSIVNSPVEGAL